MAKLASTATAADAVAPLSEQTLLRVEQSATGVQHLLVVGEHGLIGYAQLDATGAAELVVAPAARRAGVGGELLRRLTALNTAHPATLQVWAHGELPAASALAASAGMTATRVLLQLRRSLEAALPEPVWPEGVRTRTFVVGQDEPAWIAVNNAAFAAHPEQGGWTLSDIAQREQKSWFDPDGFFLAERNGEIIGFHWTKVHSDESPPIGEVYVVGVRPQDSGQRLGPALTLAGLHYLQSRNLSEVMLYVDESNTAAVKTYDRLGFRRWAKDVLYERVAQPDRQK